MATTATACVVLGHTLHISGHALRANVPMTSSRSQLSFGSIGLPHSGSSGWPWQSTPLLAYVVVVAVVVVVVDSEHSPHMIGHTLRTNAEIVSLWKTDAAVAASLLSGGAGLHRVFVRRSPCPHSGCSAMPWHTLGRCVVVIVVVVAVYVVAVVVVVPVYVVPVYVVLVMVVVVVVVVPVYVLVVAVVVVVLVVVVVMQLAALIVIEYSPLEHCVHTRSEFDVAALDMYEPGLQSETAVHIRS